MSADSKRLKVGFISSTISMGVECIVWNALVRHAKQCNVDLFSFVGSEINPADSSKSGGNKVYELVGAKAVDGVIIWAANMNWNISSGQMKQFMVKLGVPVISFDAEVDGFPSVLVDNKGGISSAVEHMINVHGIKKFGFIRGPESAMVANERFDAFTETLKRHAIPIDPNNISPCESWVSQTKLKDFLSRPELGFECLISVNDYKALYAVEFLESRNIKVPEQIKILGFDDDTRGKSGSITMTTVSPNHSKAICVSLDLMLNMIQQQKISPRTVVSTELCVRETCGCESASVAFAHGGGNSENSILMDKRREKEDLLEKVLCLTPQQNESDSLYALMRLVHDQMKSIDDLDIWQDALSLWERKHKKSRDSLLANKARIIIGSAASRSLSMMVLHQEQFRNRFLEVCQNIVSSQNMDQIKENVYKGFVGLGIKTFCISLFRDQYDASQGFKPLVAAQNGGRVPEESLVRAVADQLVPNFLQGNGNGQQLLVLPLFFQEDSLGIVLFDDGLTDGLMYELLRGQLSSALRGVMLYNHLQASASALEAGVSTITNNLQEVIGTSERISDNMASQSAAVQQQAASIAEMVRNIRNLTEMTDQSRKIGKELSEVSLEGNKFVGLSITAIKNVEKHSENIQEMLHIIRDVAEQTNILAINAAIEAVHAGESGRGFAIVSAEIRRLSESTAVSVAKITLAVRSIIESINVSVGLSSTVGEKFAQINTYSERNSDYVEKVGRVMVEQESATTETLQATQDLIKIADEVSTAVQNENNSIEQIAQSLAALGNSNVK